MARLKLYVVTGETQEHHTGNGYNWVSFVGTNGECDAWITEAERIRDQYGSALTVLSADPSRCREALEAILKHDPRFEPYDTEPQWDKTHMPVSNIGTLIRNALK